MVLGKQGRLWYLSELIKNTLSKQIIFTYIHESTYGRLQHVLFVHEGYISPLTAWLSPVTHTETHTLFHNIFSTLRGEGLTFLARVGLTQTPEMSPWYPWFKAIHHAVVVSLQWWSSVWQYWGRGTRWLSICVCCLLWPVWRCSSTNPTRAQLSQKTMFLGLERFCWWVNEVLCSIHFTHLLPVYLLL